MKHYCQLVFSDFVVGTTATFTSPKFNDLLATADRSAIQAIVDQVTGTSPTLTVQVEMSSDDRNWSSKNGTAEINGTALVNSATNILSGIEPGTNPGHSRARLRIALGGTSPQANVKIYVTGRDRVP